MPSDQPMTLKAYVILKWAESGIDSMQIPLREVESTEVCFSMFPACTVQYSRSITSREVFWDFRLKDLVWEWFGLLLWTSHLPKYQIQPWSHVKWPGWWLGTAIPMFPWGLNCQQLYPPPLGPPDRLSSRLNIFRL